MTNKFVLRKMQNAPDGYHVIDAEHRYNIFYGDEQIGSVGSVLDIEDVVSIDIMRRTLEAIIVHEDALSRVKTLAFNALVQAGYR